MSRLMGTLHIKASGPPVLFSKIFLVALNSYFLHQGLHEDLNVVGLHTWFHHLCIGTCLAVLAQRPHLDGAPPIHKTHVENHHDPVWRPTSPAWGTAESLRKKKDTSIRSLHFWSQMSMHAVPPAIYCMYIYINRAICSDFEIRKICHF